MTTEQSGAPVSLSGFLGLRPGGDPTRAVLDVTRPLINGLGTLWGGCGLAAGMQAMEQAAGRPCAWAAVQYIRPIKAETRVELEVTLGKQGRTLTQAQVSGTVDGELVLTGLGSLGGAAGPAADGAGGAAHDEQWVTPPERVPQPEDGGEREMPFRVDLTQTLVGRLEQRWAMPPPTLRSGVRGTGRTLLWIRFRDPVETTGASLAVLADLAPSAISEALGITAGGTSLDNTIRVARVGATAPGAWVLLDLTVEGVVGSVAQLSARLFDRDGRLLAVAGQSAVVRPWPPGRGRPGS